MAKNSWKGWDFITFLKGRKRLLIALIGGVIGWMTTQNPEMSAGFAIAAEMAYAAVDYYLQP